MLNKNCHAKFLLIAKSNKLIGLNKIIFNENCFNLCILFRLNNALG